MKLAVIEVLDRDGHARQSVPVLKWPATIGRAVECDVLLDDAFVAAHHATIDEADGVLALEVGDSVNGAEWPGRRLSAGARAALPPDGIVLLGTTRLRVRRAADALAPERPLLPEPRVRLPLWTLLATLMVWSIALDWLRGDPTTRLTDYGTSLLAIGIVLVGWAGMWALLSKLFRHRFEFRPHARIAAGYLLVSDLLVSALPLAAFMLGIPLLSRLSGLALGALVCAMLAAHVRRIVPAYRGLIAGVMAALFAGGAVVTLTHTYQTTERYFSELYVSTFTPPALRLRTGVAPAQFLDEARALKPVLDEHARSDRFNSNEPWE